LFDARREKRVIIILYIQEKEGGKGIEAKGEGERECVREGKLLYILPFYPLFSLYLF